MCNWKPIDNTGGALEVSDSGQIRSLLRDGRVLRTQVDRKGYRRVTVTLEGRKRTFKVHREVAKAFVPQRPGKNQVNHIDGDKGNNCASNLEWVNNKENAEHAIRTGLWENVFRASAKTNESRKQAIVARDINTGEIRRFGSVSEAERYFNSRHISDVLNGKRRAAAGNTFAREVI